MSVTNGQKSSAAVFNAAFVSKIINSVMQGVLGLSNTLVPESGAVIVNAQRAINETFDAVGMSGEGDSTRKNYVSTIYISNGDSHKSAIAKLDAALDALATSGIPTSTTPGQIVLQNNVSGIDIPDLLFDSSLIRSFEFTWTAYRETTGGGANVLVQRGSVLGIFNGTDWKVVDGAATPDDAGITFAINASTGQITYSATNQAGTYDAGLATLDYLVTDIVGV